MTLWHIDQTQKSCEIYVTELATHYGSDSRIWGWQIDNKPAAIEDYSPAADDKFRDWLKQKYETLSNLNRL